MLRKSLLLLAALLFMAGANLRPVCRYELAGEPIAPGCGIRTAARAERAAQAAAEEILRAQAVPGAVTKHLRLMKSSLSYFAQTFAGPFDSIWGLVIATLVPAAMYFSDIAQW